MILLLRFWLAHCFNQHFGNFGPRELGRWYLTSTQHLAHLRPAQNDMMLAIMRAGLLRCHRVTNLAEEGMIEKDGCDIQFRRIELGKDVLRIISAVVVSNACMVTSHNEM